MSLNQPGEVFTLPNAPFDSSCSLCELCAIDTTDPCGDIKLLLGKFVLVEDAHSRAIFSRT